MALTREQILQADDLPREKVATPRGDVWVRTMTAEERESWEVAIEGAGKARHQVRAAMVAATACDESGGLLFTPADVPALAGMSITFIMPLFDAAVRLSKVSPADVEAAEKNSDASPSDSSASGSPPT